MHSKLQQGMGHFSQRHIVCDAILHLMGLCWMLWVLCLCHLCASLVFGGGIVFIACHASYIACASCLSTVVHCVYWMVHATFNPSIISSVCVYAHARTCVHAHECTAGFQRPPLAAPRPHLSEGKGHISPSISLSGLLHEIPHFRVPTSPHTPGKPWELEPQRQAGWYQELSPYWILKFVYVCCLSSPKSSLISLLISGTGCSLPNDVLLKNYKSVPPHEQLTDWLSLPTDFPLEAKSSDKHSYFCYRSQVADCLIDVHIPENLVPATVLQSAELSQLMTFSVTDKEIQSTCPVLGNRQGHLALYHGITGCPTYILYTSFPESLKYSSPSPAMCLQNVRRYSVAASILLV